MMTPLLVMITVGSIVNGRLLSRLARPERLVAWGQMGLLTGCLMLIFVDAHSRQVWMLMAFAVCGFALGFQLPNLTLQIQAVVERRDVGVASALIQTMRMLGSMLGTSGAAVIINSRYASQVEPATATLGAEVQHLLDTPQVLVRVADQTQLQTLASAGQFDPGALLETARRGLIEGVHLGFAACIVLLCFAIWMAWRLPHFDAHRRDA
ncbi:hypothetical protein GCM10025770_31940 [Viridibacterium curvum]|uniref:MFS transporter n=1 Tax=Viridibacterium curvum TaxID=1101404 RepID=A0ABP9R044_9RHOO